MAETVGATSGGESSLTSRLSWPSGKTKLAGTSRASASLGNREMTVIKPQLLERFWTSSALQTNFGNKPPLGTFDCAPNRMTLCSLLHCSLPPSQPEKAVLPNSTHRSLSPVASLQRTSRKEEYSFQDQQPQNPQPQANVCELHVKQTHDVDGDKTNYGSARKLKLRAAPIDFGETTSPAASLHGKLAANPSTAAARSRTVGISGNNSRSRKAAADTLKPTQSPRNHCVDQAFLASADAAPIRLSLILPKSQQNQHVALRPYNMYERRNGRNEYTDRIRSSSVRYELQRGDMAPQTAQTAHRKASQRCVGLKHGLVPQHKIPDGSKIAQLLAESRFAHGSCTAGPHSSSSRATTHVFEKTNFSRLPKGVISTGTQANASKNGQGVLTGVSTRLRVQKHKGKPTATTKQSPVAASGPVEAGVHSPLVFECSLPQRSFLDCASHVPYLLGAISSSSPLSKCQPSMEGKTLQTTPASTAQEKVDGGGHTERETATTAAATPPVSQAGVPATGERFRKTETHSAQSLSANSRRAELKPVQSSQSCVEPPQTPGFAGKVYRSCGGHARDSEAEENAEELALLRHSGVSFVCVRALVSFLTNCCAVSHFGSDERLQQANDLSTSPFHCSSKPHIGIEEYLVKRIFRHGKQTINEGVMAVALLSRFLCKQNTLLSAALRENSQQQCQQQRFDNCSRDATVGENDFRRESVVSRTGSSPEGFAAIAARIGYIEFNYLTAHRLLLTAAFLARKTHRDDHTSIRHWAQAGPGDTRRVLRRKSCSHSWSGLSKSHLAIFLASKVKNIHSWEVQVVLTACAQTALAISLGDPRLLGKQGELQPVRGNTATTAVYLREHTLLIQQQVVPTTPATFRDLRAPEPLHHRTAPDKVQLQQLEEAPTCCMCFSCCMLQPGHPTQRNLRLPFADLAPEGRTTSQDENDVPNRSEQTGFPLSSVSDYSRETACHNLPDR